MPLERTICKIWPCRKLLFMEYARSLLKNFQAFVRLCKGPRHGCWSSTAFEFAAFHTFHWVEQARHFRLELRSERRQLRAIPLRGFLAVLDTLEHKLPDDLMGAVKRGSVARQFF